MTEQVGAGWARRWHLTGAAKERLSQDAQVQGQRLPSVPSTSVSQQKVLPGTGGVTPAEAEAPALNSWPRPAGVSGDGGAGSSCKGQGPQDLLRL